MKTRTILALALVLMIGTIAVNCKSKETGSEPTAGPTKTATQTGTATQTATITPTADSTTKGYSFNTTNDGWTVHTGGITYTAQTTITSQNGAGSLELGCSITATNYYSGGFYKAFYTTPVDLRGKTITVYLLVSGSLAAVTPAYVLNFRCVDSIANSFRTINGPTLSTSGWQAVQFVVPSSTDYLCVNYLGFTIDRTSGSTPDWIGTLWADEISW